VTATVVCGHETEPEIMTSTQTATDTVHGHLVVTGVDVQVMQSNQTLKMLLYCDNGMCLIITK